MKRSITKFSMESFVFAMALFIFLAIAGCGEQGLEGYSNEWLYPQEIETVYVKMFDTGSFRRGHEYVLTDAICKRIEAQTPYKIVSDMDQADTVLSGQMSAIASRVLAVDRFSGRPIERNSSVMVVVSWKNLQTGELLIDNEKAFASASYSTQLGQDFDYAANVAVNKAAERIVELMEKKW